MRSALTLLAGCGVVLIVVAILFGSEPGLELVAESDMLLPAEFVHGIVHDGRWASFQQPRVLSTVPDMVLFGALQGVVGDWRVAMLAHGVTMTVAMLGLTTWLIGGLAGTSLLKSAQSAVAVSAGLFLLSVGTHPARDVAALAVLPVDHGGPFALSLLVMGLAWADLASPAIGRRVWVIGLTAAGTFSDWLFIATLWLPLAGALLLSRRGSVLLPLTALAAALSLAASGLVFRQPVPPLDLGGLSSRLALFVRDLGGQPLIWALAALCVGAVALRWRDPRVTAAGLAGLGGLSVTAVFYQDLPSYRYAQPLFWWPAILLGAAIAPRLAAWRGLGLCVGVIGVAAIFVPAAAPLALLAWRSPLERCLTDARDRHDLHAGLATYWHARKTSASSQWALGVDQINSSGAAYIWGNDPVNYLRGPGYGFIVMADTDEVAIRRLYGPPDQVLQCPGTDVWLYDDTISVRSALRRASPVLDDVQARMLGSIDVPPERLTGMDATRTGGMLTAHTENPAGGVVTWGPYVTVPRGRWRVAIRYRAMSEAPSRWEIVAGPDHKALFVGPTRGVGGGPIEDSTTIDLPRSTAGVEVRTLLNGPGGVELHGIEITRAR